MYTKEYLVGRAIQEERAAAAATDRRAATAHREIAGLLRLQAMNADVERPASAVPNRVRSHISGTPAASVFPKSDRYDRVAQSAPTIMAAAKAILTHVPAGLVSQPTNPNELTAQEFSVELRKVHVPLEAFGRSLLAGREGVDDLIQATMMKAWASRKRFQAGTDMRAWTITIMRNLYLAETRRAHRERRFKVRFPISEVSFTEASQEYLAEIDDLSRALEQLSTPQREALVLISARGFSLEEAAEICGVPVGTIRSRLARGRAKTRRLMSGVGMPPRTRTASFSIARRALQAEIDEIRLVPH